MDIPLGLWKYIFSGLGSVGSIVFAPQIAQQKAKAMKITAQGEADAMKITAQGEADAINTFLSQLDPSVQITERGLILDGETIQQRISYQAKKKQRNIVSVIQEASKQLEGKEVPNHEPDHDWTSHFFNYVQDVSDEEIQILWAKILAGEVKRKGSTSRRTLRILSELDQETCRLFRRFCSMCFFVSQYRKDTLIDATIPVVSHVRVSGSDRMLYGLEEKIFHRLCEAGLIKEKPELVNNTYKWFIGVKVDDFNHLMRLQAENTLNLKSMVDLVTIHRNTPCIVRLPFRFQGKYWILDLINEQAYENKILQGISMTQAGLELSRAVELEPMDEFADEVFTYFEKRGLRMREVASPEPQIFQAYY